MKLLRWCALLGLVCGIAGEDACGIKSCQDSWTSWGKEVTLNCDLASAHFPDRFELPMMFEGNYDLCKTFDGAKFCTHTSKVPLVLPLEYDADKQVKAAFPLGYFLFEQCVAKGCEEKQLRKNFEKELYKWVLKMLLQLDAGLVKKLEIMTLVQYYMQQIQTKCVEKEPELDFLGNVTIGILLSSVVLVALGSFFACARTKEYETVLSHFDIKANGKKLVKEIPGDFNALNGIRVLSICWVITGHSLSNYQAPIQNPSSEGAVFNTMWFAYVPQGVLAVDTFFFMSGFLAAHGLLNMGTKTLTARSYLSMVLARYVRLFPSLVIAILLYWKVFPTLIDGPFSEQGTGCDDYWWTNLLYINNFIPDHGSEVCAGWTWYLANDFQFFLLVPFVTAIYQYGKSAGKSNLWKYGPCFVLIVTQLCVTTAIMYHITSDSADTRNRNDYMVKVYEKPYCRLTPYFVGVQLAIFHQERGANWKKMDMRPLLGQCIYVASISVMFGLVFSLYSKYYCEADDHECKVWLSMYRYGYLAETHWSRDFLCFYYAFQYIVWSSALSVFVYCLFLGPPSDFLHLKDFLGAQIFTPLARLTYNVYLIHIPIMMIKSGNEKFIGTFSTFRAFIIEVSGYVLVSFTAATFLYFLIEKPCTNMLTSILKGRAKSPGPPTNNTQSSESSSTPLLSPVQNESGELNHQ